MGSYAGITTGISLFLLFFVLVLAILWFILPFAVFGTKPKLDAIAAELKKLNATMEAMSMQQRVLVEQLRLIVAPRGMPPPPLDVN